MKIQFTDDELKKLISLSFQFLGSRNYAYTYWFANIEFSHKKGEYLSEQISNAINADSVKFTLDGDAAQICKSVTIDKRKAKKRLQHWAETEPKHFGDYLNENADYYTYESVVQSLLFDKVIFG